MITSAGIENPPVMLATAVAIVLGRVVAIAVSLCLWFWTQRLLARRNPPVDAVAETGPISDGIHRMTAKYNRRLQNDPRRSRLLLISSSLVIDLLCVYLLASAIFGATFQPFLGMFMVFALRQICQAFCPLPTPEGMIWRDPGFPTFMVTYGTSSDLFFSGHTAIAVYGAATLAAAFGPIGIALGCVIVAFEISTVLVLRAHYTMDVFAGAVTALYVHRVAIDFAPALDQLIGHLARISH